MLSTAWSIRSARPSAVARWRSASRRCAKFTPRVGCVEILLRRVDPHAELSVSGSGGLEEGFLMHLPRPVEPEELIVVVWSLARFRTRGEPGPIRRR